MVAVWTEKLNVFVPQLLIVTIKLAFALRAGHPEDFRHRSVPRIFSRKGAKVSSAFFRDRLILKLSALAPLREAPLFSRPSALDLAPRAG